MPEKERPQPDLAPDPSALRLLALQDMLVDAEITVPRREVTRALEEICRLENEGRVKDRSDFR